MASSDAPTTRERDLGMLRVMGWFFIILAILVWVGQIWEQSAPERIVNALSGAILLLVGSLMLLRHRKTSERNRSTP